MNTSSGGNTYQASGSSARGGFPPQNPPFGFSSDWGGNPPRDLLQVVEAFHLPLLLAVYPKVLPSEGDLEAVGFRLRALLPEVALVAVGFHPILL